MGVTAAGIAYRPRDASRPLDELVASLFGRPCKEIDQPSGREFDIRRSTDVMVEFYGNTCVIYNHELISDILDDPAVDTAHLHLMLDKPDLIIGFCCYDSADSYGYVFIEDGKRTRSRLQTLPAGGRSPLTEFGEPKDFEVRWLSAPSYLEEDETAPPEDLVRIYYLEAEGLKTADFSLTSRLLYEALKNNFGVCPWDTNERPKSRYFKLVAQTNEGASPEQPPEVAVQEQPVPTIQSHVAIPKKARVWSKILSAFGLHRKGRG